MHKQRTTSSAVLETVSKVGNSTGVAVGGEAAIVMEASALDMAKPPRLASKLTPNTKSWAPVAKGFKAVAKAAKFVGSVLGVASLAANATDAYLKWKSGDRMGAAKAAAKAAVDAIFLAVKATPIGMVASVGWAILSSWW